MALIFLFSEFDEKYSPIVKSWTLPDTPPSPPPKPRIFTWQWFKNHIPRLALPPFLQRRFPLNIVCRLRVDLHLQV